MTDPIDDLIEKFRPQPPEEFDWHEGHVRAVAGAARRELARELLGLDDNNYAIPKQERLRHLRRKLREIAEEGE